MSDENLTLLQKDWKWCRIIALVPYMYNYVPIISNVAKIHIIFAFDVWNSLFLDSLLENFPVWRVWLSPATRAMIALLVGRATTVAQGWFGASVRVPPSSASLPERFSPLQCASDSAHGERAEVGVAFLLFWKTPDLKINKSKGNSIIT